MHPVTLICLPADAAALTACVHATLDQLAAAPALTVSCAADAARCRLLAQADPAAFDALRAASDAGRIEWIYDVPAAAQAAAFAAAARADLTYFAETFGQRCETAFLRVPGCPATLPQLLTKSGLRFCILQPAAGVAAPAPQFWWDGAGGARLLAVCGDPAIRPLAAADTAGQGATACLRALCMQPLDLPTLRCRVPETAQTALPLPAGMRIEGDGIALLAAASEADGTALLLAETAGRETAAAVMNDAPEFGFYADFQPYELKAFLVDAQGCVAETDFLCRRPAGEDA